ncbi:citrate synthase [Mucisphaera calidilacus]|uniref:Citrate synthase n=1 Tax=Mucisphaera calidilacus TaxID=2527982 RepID=A0A518BZ45_9BACT|nr:citrate synthase [Mucisphaera calidilacus]QDU72243.1 Citrate synthase 1 [Mucisphaera calidilacus]
MTQTASKTAQITIGEQSYEAPLVVGSEGEVGLDITGLRGATKAITLDEGYRNTGACESNITFINPEKGILRHRGYPIEQIAEKLSFIETALLLFEGEVPSPDRLKRFSDLLTANEMLHEGVRQFFDGFPSTGHPMAILSAMINTVSCYQPDVMELEDEDTFDVSAAQLISKVRTVAAAAYKMSIGHPIMYPDPNLSYCANFLHMMFSIPKKVYEPDQDIVDALNLFFILHADHEQNCSTSTVRLVGSSQANLFASCAAGVCALWGPLHGGANVAIMNQLQELHSTKMDLGKFIEGVKQKEYRLFGFGHPVYKSFDPRAKILSAAADRVLAKLGVNDPLLELARRLEDVALNDDYFVSRNLYPNVDFYSGIILRAIGIPVNMFTVMFAIGRMPGWIAHWKEVRDRKSKIYRPRQIYTGPTERSLA